LNNADQLQQLVSQLFILNKLLVIVCYCVFAAEAVLRNHQAEQLGMLYVVDHAKN